MYRLRLSAVERACDNGGGRYIVGIIKVVRESRPVEPRRLLRRGHRMASFGAPSSVPQAETARAAIQRTVMEGIRNTTGL